MLVSRCVSSARAHWTLSFWAGLISMYRKKQSSQLRSVNCGLPVRSGIPVGRLEKRTETEADINAFLDEILRERADQSLEHVFSLFATVLPRDPIKIAFRALHTNDKTLRGLAAEYLDSVLPQSIRERLWVMVESGAPKKQPNQASGQAALDTLLRSHESLMLLIKKL